MNILIINGHPDTKSFTADIANKIYATKSSNAHDTKIIHLADLDFDPVFKGYGKHNRKNLEKDLVQAQRLISQSDHIIITTPIWWSTYPALLKGFFDRTLLPGFGFQYNQGKSLPQKLLGGKTAELVLLSDAPVWYRYFIQRDPAAKTLKRDILGFCGIKVKKIRRIGSVGSMSKEDRAIVLNSF